MSEQPGQAGRRREPSLDNDSRDDVEKGAALGGIGGAVAGAVTGSLAVPVGTLAGAVIGGIVGAVTSKAAVGAIDRMEHVPRFAAAEDTALDLSPRSSGPAAIEPAEATGIRADRYEEPEELPVAGRSGADPAAPGRID